MQFAYIPRIIFVKSHVNYIIEGSPHHLQGSASKRHLLLPVTGDASLLT